MGLALLCVGVLFAGDEGAAGAVGLVALAQGIGAAESRRVAGRRTQSAAGTVMGAIAG